MAKVMIGIIGGSGLDDPQFLMDARDVAVDTAYGQPSSPLRCGRIGDVDVILLSRHGRTHAIPPSKVNYRANIAALKQIGCTHILATTACGSLRDEIGRGDIVIPDQFIDHTRHRSISFHDSFADGVHHVAMAEPFSKELRSILASACADLGLRHHRKGTVITIEGPRFSTIAESRMFRSWGADIINMSVAPEAILANEVGIPYAVVAMSTDYDCWKEDERVSWEQIVEVFGRNVEKVTKILMHAIPRIVDPLAIVRESIRTIPDWPKPGVMFRDVTTLLKDTKAFATALDALVDRYSGKRVDIVAGIESRGFIIGSALAHRLGIGFIPIRKKGKLPAETVAEEYELEYGTDCVEMHKDAVCQGMKVLVVDDLIATGGTALAACNLVRKLDGEVAECCFIIDLPDLGGRKKLEAAGIATHALIAFEGH